MTAQLVDAHRVAAAFYQEQLARRPDGWAAQQLRDRGLGAVLARGSDWWVGYAPEGWSRTVNHLRRSGIKDEVIVAAGLASVTSNGYLVDRFRDRLMFVARDIDLRPVGFIGRADGTRLRYLNTPRTPIYAKAKTVVGLDGQLERLRDGAVPVLVEGPMDAVAVSLAGEEWAGAATCGTAVTLEQALIARKHSRVSTVIVALDGDVGGRTGAVRSLEVLSQVFDEVLFAQLPSGQDPAKLYAADQSQLRAVLGSARPLAEFAIDVELERWNNVLDHVSGQVNAVRAVAPLVAGLPARRIATEIAKLSRAVHLDEQIVSREILAAVTRRPLHQFRRQRIQELEDGADPPDYSRSP